MRVSDLPTHKRESKRETKTSKNVPYTKSRTAAMVIFIVHNIDHIMCHLKNK